LSEEEEKKKNKNIWFQNAFSRI